MPPSRAASKRTTPLCRTSESLTERQAMSCPGITSTTSAVHCTGTPAGPETVQAERLSASGRTSRTLCMKRGKFWKSVQNSNTRSTGAATWMVFCTVMPRSPKPSRVLMSRLVAARASSAVPDTPSSAHSPPRARVEASISAAPAPPTAMRAAGDQFSCRSSKRSPVFGSPPCSEETLPGSL